jgi:demethylmenaquinone methyltransferase/2-methoxy-6-polyprenyl-1,4-benzoquinol methylase
MFDGIARRYDLLNHLLSLSLDRRWRRAAAAELAGAAPGIVLDLCGGTGDMTLAVRRAAPGAFVVCCDFSHGMLERAAAKLGAERAAGGAVVLEADGLRLPLAEAAVDAVTIAFGVRNFHDLDAGLCEVRRVLRPGGRLVILEFSAPTGPLFGRLYRAYLRHLLPRIGDRVSGRSGPYGYLARTIAGFPDQAALAGRIRDQGFAACGWKNLTGGIVAVHTAMR